MRFFVDMIFKSYILIHDGFLLYDFSLFLFFRSRPYRSVYNATANTVIPIIKDPATVISIEISLLHFTFFEM